jgi:hypothetical protein
VINPLQRKRSQTSARRAPLTFESIVAGYAGSPPIEVVECAIFYAEKMSGADVDAEIDRLEDLRAAMESSARAWAGFKPLDTVAYRVGPNDPIGGDFRILSVRVPADSAPLFVGVALTDLFDWGDDGRKVAQAGESCEIPVAHVEPKRERAYA